MEKFLDIYIKWKKIESTYENDIIVDEYYDLIDSFLNKSDSIVILEPKILKNAISLCIENNEETNMIDLLMLLTNRKLIIDLATKTNNKETMNFWLVEFEKIEKRDNYILKIVNRMQEIIFNEINYNMWYIKWSLDWILNSKSNNEEKIEELKNFLLK